MEEIGRLTPYQIREVYFRPEDKDSSGSGLSEKEMFWRVNCEWRGFSEEQVQKLWDEHVRRTKEGRSKPPVTDKLAAAK